MATQSVHIFHQQGRSATVPALRCPAPVGSRQPLTPPILRLRGRREGKAVQEREKLLVDMLPLVKRVALKIRKCLPAHVELDDLFSDGVLGLVDAVTKFDASKRVRLETYARHRIRGSILDGLRGADPASRDLRRKNQRIQELYHELEVKLGRPVKDEEMAAAQGRNLAQWHRALNEVQSVGFDVGARTLSAGPTAKRPCAEAALLEDDDPDPFDLCYRREQREILGRALSSLRERERQIITLHYYQQELPMKQIADCMKVDASRVSQLHAAALVRLKANMDSLLHPGQAETSETGGVSLAAGAGA